MRDPTCCVELLGPRSCAAHSPVVLERRRFDARLDARAAVARDRALALARAARVYRLSERARGARRSSFGRTTAMSSSLAAALTGVAGAARTSAAPRGSAGAGSAVAVVRSSAAVSAGTVRAL